MLQVFCVLLRALTLICFQSDNVERRVIERERLQHELTEYDDKLNRQVEG